MQPSPGGLNNILHFSYHICRPRQQGVQFRSSQSVSSFNSVNRLTTFVVLCNMNT